MKHPESHIFKATDALMLWAWNEFGVSWRSVSKVTTVIAYGAVILAAWDSKNWLLIPLWMVLGTLGYLRAQFIPTDGHNAAALHVRLGPFFTLIRVCWFAFVLLDPRPLHLAACALMIIDFYVFHTLIPTGPRKPSFKFSAVPQGA